MTVRQDCEAVEEPILEDFCIASIKELTQLYPLVLHSAVALVH